MCRSKKGGVRDDLPDDPFNDPDYEENTHPERRKNGRYDLIDKKAGRKIELEKGKPGETGHKGHDHYHIPNPNSKGKRDRYLDANGEPCANGSDASHLYPPSKVWWK